MKIKTYWILINYNNSIEIQKLILKYNNHCEFVIVDNSNNYKKENDELVLVPKKNIGYIGGFKYALKHIINPNEARLIFSNSDIKIQSGSEKLFSFKEKLTYVQTPRIISPKGEQNPHILKRKTNNHWVIRKIASQNVVFWNLWLFLVNFKKHLRKQSSDIKEQYIYAGHGSFFIFNKINFTDFVKLKHNFLYGEEIHLAEYFFQNQIPVLFDRDIVVFHEEHSTTSKLNNNFRRKLFHDSYKSILNNYY